jgi:hypothetical protein
MSPPKRDKRTSNDTRLTISQVEVPSEDSPLLPPGGMSLNYNSDSAIYEYEGPDSKFSE